MPFCLGYARTVPVKTVREPSPTAVAATRYTWDEQLCLHGILDNPEVLDNLAEGFDKETTDHPFDYAAFKEEQYDKLANLVRKHVDMDYIYRQLV